MLRSDPAMLLSAVTNEPVYLQNVPNKVFEHFITFRSFVASLKHSINCFCSSLQLFGIRIAHDALDIWIIFYCMLTITVQLYVNCVQHRWKLEHTEVSMGCYLKSVFNGFLKGLLHPFIWIQQILKECNNNFDRTLFIDSSSTLKTISSIKWEICTGNTRTPRKPRTTRTSGTTRTTSTTGTPGTPSTTGTLRTPGTPRTPGTTRTMEQLLSGLAQHLLLVALALWVM